MSDNFTVGLILSLGLVFLAIIFGLLHLLGGPADTDDTDETD